MARRPVLIALIVLGLLDPASARQVMGAIGPSVTGSGRLTGIVIDADSGRPVRQASVALFGTLSFGLGYVGSTTTDDEGAFAFDRLSVGSFTVRASKPGFLELDYGQLRPGTETPGRWISVKDKEHVDRLVLSLSRGSSIAGVVRDNRGDPVFGAWVRASRWVTVNGRRSLREVATAQTDERGAYRIGLLPSRHYIVSAIPEEPSQSGDERRPHYGLAPAFHPSAVSVRDAEPVALGLSEHRLDVDLTMVRVRLVDIAGVVLDADGRPLPNFSVSLFDELAGESTELELTTAVDGRFTFPDLAPGTYVVRAGYVISNLMDVRSIVMPPAVSEVRSADGKGTAIAELIVADGAMPELVLRLVAPRDVAGRVTFDGASARPTMTIEVLLQSTDGLAQQFEGQVGADSTFVVKGVPPGRYRVTTMGFDEPWALSAATSAGLDVLDGLLDVRRDREVRDLVLVHRDRPTQLDGIVMDASGRAVSDRRVIVFPADERLWATAEDRIDAFTLTLAGAFRFTGLRPGAYLLAVAADIEHGDWFSPDFLRTLAATAVPVTLTEGARTTRDLRVR